MSQKSEPTAKLKSSGKNIDVLTIKETLSAYAKAFSRSPVQALTMREAAALGIVPFNFGPRDKWRQRLGKAVLAVSGWMRRRRGSVVYDVEPRAVAEMFRRSQPSIFEVPTADGKTEDEFKAALFRALQEPGNEPLSCPAMDAYRRVFEKQADV
jgi:hypothetical protein